jgi:hypothetical protein
MPFKDQEQYRRYMRQYMLQKRSEEQQLKHQMLADVQKAERLRLNFPDAYKLLFGKRHRK